MRPMACEAAIFAADFGESLDRHGLVALVIQIKGSPAFGVVTNRAFERNHGAVFARYEALDDGARIDRLAGKREEVAGSVLNFMRVWEARCCRSAAHGRQKSHFVSIG